MSTVSPSRHEAEDDQKDECKQDQNCINPTDDDETLDNRASRKRLARVATVNLVGQSCKGGDANKVENE